MVISYSNFVPIFTRAAVNGHKKPSFANKSLAGCVAAVPALLWGQHRPTLTFRTLIAGVAPRLGDVNARQRPAGDTRPQAGSSSRSCLACDSSRLKTCRSDVKLSLLCWLCQYYIIISLFLATLTWFCWVRTNSSQKRACSQSIVPISTDSWVNSKIRSNQSHCLLC